MKNQPTMNYLSCLCLLVLYTGLSMAQTITIYDIHNNQPIEGAVLFSERPQALSVTNAQGQADVSLLVDAEYIEVAYKGYITQFITYGQLQSDGYVIRMYPTIFNLDEVVVSASRWRQSSSNVPSKVVFITPQEVALQNPQTAADLLGISGKVFIQKSQQGGGSPMIRGFAANRLIYTIDGVRMNTAIFRGGNLQNVINLDPFATEKTEVLFGPGSVIYGSDAIGGVMSFLTLTPQFSFTQKPLITGKAVGRYASANREKTIHLDFDIGSKKWASVTSFSAWDYDHMRQGGNGPDDYIKNVYPLRQADMDVVVIQDDPLLQIPSAYSQMNIMQKVRFKPNARWNIQYGFHYSQTSSYGRYDRHNRFRNGTIRYAEWDYGPQKWMMNHLKITEHKENAIYDKLSLIIAQQSFEESRIDRTFQRNLRNTQTERVEAYSMNLDLTKSTSSSNTIYYGTEYVRNNVDSRGMVSDITTTLSQVGPSRYPVSVWNSIAAYVNDEWKRSEKHTVQAGLRYNLYRLEANFNNNLDFYTFPFANANINQGALTGSLGSIYKPTKSWAIKVNFGTAFRSPNVDDVGKIFDSEPGAVVVPNPKLNAEYAYNLDLAVAKVFRNWVKLDISGYYTVLQNAMVRRDFQFDGRDSIVYDGVLSKVQAIQNAAMTNIYGLQLGVEIKLLEGFRLLSDLNYQKGNEELDDGSTSSPRHAAPLFGVSRLRYRQQALTIELYAMYQGEIGSEDLAKEEQSKDEIYAKDQNGKNYAPSWYTLNLKAEYQLNDALSVNIGLENIGDRRYRPYSSGLSAAGRNFIISVSAAF